jgi:probable lipoprotein NlpC
MWYDNYIGIPFVEKGRDDSGVDCWGLVRLVYANHLGIFLPSYIEAYESTLDRETLKDIIKTQAEYYWEEPKKPEEFDVIMLRMHGLVTHMGIVTKPGHMIHCMHDINTTHERYDSLALV